MSHFCLGVRIPCGNENIIDDIETYLTASLQPWHEYESTGINDQYVQQVDYTDELIKDYTSLSVMYFDKEANEYKYPYSIPKDKLKKRRLSEEEEKLWKSNKLVRDKRDISIEMENNVPYMYSIPNEYKEVQMAECNLEELTKYIESGYNIQQLIRNKEDAPENMSYAYIAQDFDTGPYSRNISLEDIKTMLKENVQLFKLTNPNAKWDWWEVGGRFCLYNKHNEAVNICKIKDLRLFSQHDYEVAERLYDLVINEKFDGTDEEKQRFLVYNGWGISKDRMERAGSKEAFAKDYAKFRTYAFIKDGQWYEPGEMGWFACTNATPESQEAYDKAFDKMIEESNPEDCLVCVDCHI